MIKGDTRSLDYGSQQLMQRSKRRAWCDRELKSETRVYTDEFLGLQGLHSPQGLVDWGLGVVSEGLC